MKRVRRLIILVILAIGLSAIVVNAGQMTRTYAYGSNCNVTSHVSAYGKYVNWSINVTGNDKAAAMPYYECTAVLNDYTTATVQKKIQLNT